MLHLRRYRPLYNPCPFPGGFKLGFKTKETQNRAILLAMSKNWTGELTPRFGSKVRSNIVALTWYHFPIKITMVS